MLLFNIISPWPQEPCWFYSLVPVPMLWVWNRISILSKSSRKLKWKALSFLWTDCFLLCLFRDCSSSSSRYLFASLKGETLHVIINIIATQPFFSALNFRLSSIEILLIRSLLREIRRGKELIEWGASLGSDERRVIKGEKGVFVLLLSFRMIASC